MSKTATVVAALASALAHEKKAGVFAHRQALIWSELESIYFSRSQIVKCFHWAVATRQMCGKAPQPMLFEVATSHDADLG